MTDRSGWGSGRRAAMAAALCLVGGGTARAAPPLDLSGSLRLRYETVDGQLRAGFNRDDDLLNTRVTLRAAYDPGPVHVVAEMFDSRVALEDAGTPVTTAEVNALELVQAYAGVKLPDLLGAGSTLTVDAGRMMLNIGSRRLVAADDYRNTTSGYTGIRAEFAGVGEWSGTLIAVLPQVRLPDDLPSLRDADVRVDRESFDLTLWGGTVAHGTLIGPLTAEMSVYRLHERDRFDQPTRDRSLLTIGGRLFRDPKPGRWDVEVEGFYQTGHISASTAAQAARLGVRAWFVHAEAGHQFDAPWQPRLSVEFDGASGDGSGRRFGRFDTLFGMRRPDYSPSGLFAAIGRANILTPGVRLETTPGERIDTLLTYKAIWLEARGDAFATTGVRDPAGASGRFAGHQLDARLRWWMVPKRLRFEVDALLFANGAFLKRAPNGPAQDHARYLSLNLTTMF